MTTQKPGKTHDMALHAPALTFIDRGHTGGRELASDILLPAGLVDITYLAITDEDEQDGGLGFTEVDDGFGPFWVWRKK